MHTIERGDAQHHVIAQALSEMIEHFTGVVALQVDQDGGDDLRMFIAHQLSNRLRIHPFQALDAAGVARAENAVEQRGSLVFA